MTNTPELETIDDADLDQALGAGRGNLTLKRGTFSPDAPNGVLFFDEEDAVTQPTAGWATFEPNAQA